MLKNRNNFPPGGFKFLQPETGWQAPANMSFDSTVQSIIAHRRANPRFNLPTDYETVATELDAYTSARLQGVKGGEQWLVVGAPNAPFAEARQRVVAAAAGVNKYVRNTSAGIGLYLSWIGGRPVKREQAIARGEVCLGCPKHVDGNIGQRFNQEAAKEIMAIFGVLKDLQMTTPLDDRLKICDACDCPMKAKVWPDLKTIKKHLRPDAEAALWENCWIRKESAA